MFNSYMLLTLPFKTAPFFIYVMYITARSLICMRMDDEVKEINPRLVPVNWMLCLEYQTAEKRAFFLPPEPN